jgi:hypothetical protein
MMRCVKFGAPVAHVRPSGAHFFPTAPCSSFGQGSSVVDAPLDVFDDVLDDVLDPDAPSVGGAFAHAAAHAARSKAANVAMRARLIISRFYANLRANGDHGFREYVSA